jgi:hypothetical protein
MFQGRNVDLTTGCIYEYMAEEMSASVVVVGASGFTNGEHKIDTQLRT